MPIRLKKEQMEALEAQGLITKSTKPSKTPRPVKKINPELFKAMAKANGLPDPIPEFTFHRERKWRFDWLFNTRLNHPMVALEIQGGLFSQGGHTRGAALTAEYEKLNMAQIMGYKVLLVTHEQVESGEAFSLVKRALHGEQP